MRGYDVQTGKQPQRFIGVEVIDIQNIKSTGSPARTRLIQH